MWVTIYDPFTCNLNIDGNWNRLDYPRMVVLSSPFFLCVESRLGKSKCSLLTCTDCIHIVIHQTWTAESEVLHTILPSRLLNWLQNPNPNKHNQIGSPSNWYTAFKDSYLFTIWNKLSLNLCNFNCCPSPKSQLYPLSKSCKILQHTDNSGPNCHHSYARTKGIMNYRWRCHMQGRS